MANGDTKTEAMLNVLGNGGTGDEFRGCCNTKTQTYILDAIDRMNSISGATDMVGATADTAGEHGLVPAPAAGDQNKYLRGDGTWSDAGGGGGTSDFNDLSNRPSYNGTIMTGSTNIPEVKTYTAGTNITIDADGVISSTATYEPTISSNTLFL